MQVCLVCASDGLGGLEKHVAELAIGLVQHGHDVTVVAPESFSILIDAQITHLVVNFRGPRWSPFVKSRLKKALQTKSWDVIHAHANKAAKLVSSIRKDLSAKKFVATLHNFKSNTKAFSTFDDVIVVSQALVHSVKAERVHVIMNGIKPSSPSGQNSRAWLASLAGLDESQPIVLGVGRLVQAKGFERLIEAAALADVQVVIVGDGPEKQALLNLKAKLQAQKVSLLGHRTDVFDLLDASDGLVITSYHEGGPYTLVEALMLNRPVLATAVGMVTAVLPPSLILSNDVNEMALVLGRWVSMLPEWNNECASAMCFAQQQLTVDAMVKSTMTAYSDQS